MISSSELRKGNMIMYEGVVVEVISILGDYAVCRTTNNKLVICPYDKAEPVLLNNLIYETLGFKRKNFGWTKESFMLYDAASRGGSVIILSTHINCPCIESLHQLQNLYYSLQFRELVSEGWGIDRSVSA
jgi:hypothetical protein